MDPDRQENQALAPQNQEDETLLNTQYGQSKYAICILFLFGLLCIPIGISYSNYSSIAPQMQQLYGLSVSFMNLTNSAYFGMSIIFFLPSIYSLSYCPIRFNILTIVIAVVVGAWMQCLINHSFIFAFIGSYIIGISFAYMKNIVTRISSIWFAPHRRVLSTSIMYSLLFALDSLSFNFPVLFISKDNIPQSQQPYYRTQVLKMHITKATIATVSGILVLIFFRQKPSKPVSPTVLIPRFNLSDTLPKFFSNRDFLLIAIFYTIVDGTSDAHRVILREAFGQYGVTSKMVGVAALIAVFVGLFFMNLCGWSSSRLRQFKFLLMTCGVGNLVIITLTLLFIQIHSPYGLALTFPAYSAFTKFATPLVYELIAEICFPIPEAFSGSALNFLLKIVTFSMIQLSSVFINHNIVPEFMWLLFALQIVAMAALYFANEQFRRRDTDDNIIQAKDRQKAEEQFHSS